MKFTGSAATPKQVDFIKSLVRDREVDTKWTAMVDAEVEKGLPKERASKWIEWLLQQPKREVNKTAAPLTIEPGIWVIPDENNALFQIKKSRSTGKPYALRIDLSGARPTYAYEAGKAHDVQAKGKPVSTAVAIQIGISSGVCLVCGAPLSDEESVKRGIGPVCFKRQEALHAAHHQGGTP